MSTEIYPKRAGIFFETKTIHTATSNHIKTKEIRHNYFLISFKLILIVIVINHTYLDEHKVNRAVTN